MPANETPSQPTRYNPNYDEKRHAMGRPPRGILRWGMWGVAGFVALLLALAAGLKYPDVLTAEVEIVLGSPPIRIVTKTDGAIGQLLVADSARVDSGQLLAITAQSASLTDVQTLESWLDSATTSAIQYASPPSALSLGSLQPAYSNAVFQFERWRKLMRYDDTALRLQSLQRQWGRAQQLDSAALRQIRLLDTTIALADRSYREYATLAQSGAASALEVENALLILLQHKKEREQQNALRLSYLQESERLRFDLSTLQMDFQRRNDDEFAALQATLGALRGAISQWKEDWCYYAPSDGRILLTGLRNNWQYMEQGQEMFAIVPEKSQSAASFATGLLPAEGAGMLSIGAEANIRLYDYPYAKYGEIPATLSTITLINNQDNHYYFLLALPRGLTTTANFKVPVKYGMRGNARLITQRRSLLSRLRSDGLQPHRSDGLQPSDR
jgi:multidrug resistance efflux pump